MERGRQRETGGGREARRIRFLLEGRVAKLLDLGVETVDV